MTKTAGMTPMTVKPSARWSALWGVGMLAIFFGERMIGAGGARAVATVGGILMVIAALAVRAGRAASAAPDRRPVERMLLGLYAVGLFAVVIYFVQSDLPTVLGKGKLLEHGSPRLATALAALWPAIWLAAAWPIALIEMAYAQIARAPKIEAGRVRDAMYSGLGLAAALIFAVTVTYVASERDKKVDLAYFRTTRPGEVSRRIVRNLDQPLEVAEFFPEGSEVREEVDNYMQDLGRESAQLKVVHYDFDIDPLKAKEYGISSNGVIVFVRGTRHDQLGLPREIESAKNALRTLDKEVQQRLMMMVKPPRTVGFTQGHGERNWEKPTSDTDKRATIKSFRDVLVDQNYDVRYVGAADGLMQDVPKEITVLMIIGPQKPFLPEESASLNRFIDRGGRLLIALDPENHVDMPEVLKPLDLEYHDVMLANDQAFARRTHQDNDRTNLVTVTYSSHPSVTTLQRMGVRAPIILPGAGWLNANRTAKSGVTVDAPIKAHHATFEDKNGNFQQDPGEDRRAWEVAATAVKKEARVFVLADSDLFGDEALPVAANQYLAIDVSHWLMGDEAFTGMTSTEADAPVSHTRKQDVVWFYSTIFLGPTLVLGAGMAITRRGRRKQRRRPSAPTGPAGSSGAQGASS
jgi:hypothetical protein